jgi:hypothetical protein
MRSKNHKLKKKAILTRIGDKGHVAIAASIGNGDISRAQIDTVVLRHKRRSKRVQLTVSLSVSPNLDLHVRFDDVLEIGIQTTHTTFQFRARRSVGSACQRSRATRKKNKKTKKRKNSLHTSTRWRECS